MEPRSIQVGDIVQVTVQNQNYYIPIDRIDNYGIHAQKYTIIPVGNNWQIQNYNIPHSVSFYPAPEQKPSTPIRHVFAEGGGGRLEFFTELELLSDDKAKILGHYYLFLVDYDKWPEANKEAMKLGAEGQIEKEKGELAVRYRIRNPPAGISSLYEFVNPQHIYDYYGRPQLIK